MRPQHKSEAPVPPHGGSGVSRPWNEPTTEEIEALEAAREWTKSSSGPGVRILRVLLRMAERSVVTEQDWFSGLDADRNRCAVRDIEADQGKAEADPTHDARDVAGVGIDEARRNAAAATPGENREEQNR